ncbi:hypothetical protein D3C75_504880 [compost metagenome]
MNPFHLIQTDLVPTPVIQLGGARRGMVGHRRRVFQGAPVFQIRGDPGGAEGVIADRRLDPGRQGPSAHHGMRVGLRQDGRTQLPGTALNRAKQGAF